MLLPNASFGDYLANIQTSIFTLSFQQVGTNWAHFNQKHEFNLLYYIISGDCQIQADDVHLQPSAGDLVLLPAGTTITTSSDKPHFSKYYCHFASTIGETPLFDLLKLSTLVHAEDQAATHQQFEQLMHHSRNRTVTSMLHSKAILHQLLCSYIDQSPICLLQNTDQFEPIHTVIQYIEHHLAERLTVEKLAGLIHLHPNYFIQVFKSMIGCPPMQYITKLRYESACLLLSTTALGCNEIAGKIGIVPEYFTKFFRHHSGLSPTAYRKKN
ncbi:AraC family transcriptional regulator [Paenibacillus eucommiae]|uniref:YesN/AraC family two-component response regulator n=1 Tax=Paenibacillus eucommiae TaxID=1355755 RepID=A0ABS4INL7_9BACL|nr:AraC family transcriptional regulator [Paenibacillus eucommiae]MBP1988621.1 YesN/AraC family two-component response regulator [Paenibacillus eucommiae]